MTLRVFQPNRLLEPYVSAIWDYEDLLGGGSGGLSILPDTATYLCFLYADRLTTAHKGRIYTTRSGLAGFQTFRSDLGGFGTVSGVSARLTPWGLNVFCRGVVRDCSERRVDCRDLFPPYGVEQIEDELAQKQTPQARVQCVEQYLLALLDRGREDRLIQAACKALDRSGGTQPIARLARTLGLTERTLERRFQAHIGATPKKYARIVRLRKAMLHHGHLGNWADVASVAGYYDQSHMIRDFREFYGMAPETLGPQLEKSPTLRFSGLMVLPQGGS